MKKTLTTAELRTLDWRKLCFNYWIFGEITVSVILMMYSKCFIGGSQPFFCYSEAHCVPSWVSTWTAPEESNFRVAKDAEKNIGSEKLVFFSLRAYGAVGLVCNSSFRLRPFPFHWIWRSRRNKK